MRTHTHYMHTCTHGRTVRTRMHVRTHVQHPLCFSAGGGVQRPHAAGGPHILSLQGHSILRLLPLGRPPAGGWRPGWRGPGACTRGALIMSQEGRHALAQSGHARARVHLCSNTRTHTNDRTPTHTRPHVYMHIHHERKRTHACTCTHARTGV